MVINLLEMVQIPDEDEYGVDLYLGCGHPFDRFLSYTWFVVVGRGYEWFPDPWFDIYSMLHGFQSRGVD